MINKEGIKQKLNEYFKGKLLTKTKNFIGKKYTLENVESLKGLIQEEINDLEDEMQIESSIRKVQRIFDHTERDYVDLYIYDKDCDIETIVSEDQSKVDVVIADSPIYKIRIKRGSKTMDKKSSLNLKRRDCKRCRYDFPI